MRRTAFLFFCLCGLRIAPALAAPALEKGTPSSCEGPRRVLVTVLEGLSFDDLHALKGKKKAGLDRAAVGWMNATTPTTSRPESHYLTYGAGARAGHPEIVGGFRDVTDWNRERNPSVRLGALARLAPSRAYTLISQTVSGNSPPSAMMLFDERGGLDDVSHIPIDVTQVGDWGALAADLLDARKASPLAVLDATLFLEGGDRRERLADLLSAAAGIWEDACQTTIVTGGVPERLYPFNGADLIPVMYFDRERGSEGGLLTSNSTRRAGLILNVDLTRDIVARLGGTPEPGQTGRETRFLHVTDRWATMRRFDRQVRTVEWAAMPVYYLIGTVGGLCGLTAILAAMGPGGLSSGRERVFQAALGGLFALPAGVLLSGFWPCAPGFWHLAAPVAAALSGMAWVPGPPESFLRRIRSFARLAAGIAIASIFLKQGEAAGVFTPILNGVLSPSPLRGGRFFGVNNTLSGLTIGAAAAGAIAGWLEREGEDKAPSAARGRWTLALVVCAALFAAPGSAANMGASATFFLVAFLAFWAAGPNRNWVAGSAAGLVMAFVCVAVSVKADELAGYSHLGFALDDALNQNGALLGMIFRKLTLNLHFLTLTAWSWVMVVLYAAFVWTVWGRLGPLKAAGDRWPRTYSGLTAALAAGIAAFLLNDTGGAIVAFMALYLAGTLLAMAGTARFGALVERERTAA